jgi:hypothetical protein
MQDCIVGVPQPRGNFSCLKRSISGTEVPIQQLGDLLSGARFLDLVQGSPYVFVETTIRIWQFAHQRFSGREANLLRRAHSCGSVAAVWEPQLRGTSRYQLENQSANHIGLMLSGRTGQPIRSFKAVRSFHPQLPILARAGSGDGHSPVASSVGERVFDSRSNFPAQLSIAEILPFDCPSQSTAFYRPHALPICGANRSKLTATGSPKHHEHAYSQFVLKTAGKCHEEDRSM